MEVFPSAVPRPPVRASCRHGNVSVVRTCGCVPAWSRSLVTVLRRLPTWLDVGDDGLLRRTCRPAQSRHQLLVGHHHGQCQPSPRRADGTVNFASLLSANNLVQLVQTPTHAAGHLLDVVIVRSDTEVTRVNVPPPVLSDHSLIDVALDLRHGSAHHETAATYRTCRSWRTFNYDEFEHDLSVSARTLATV